MRKVPRQIPRQEISGAHSPRDLRWMARALEEARKGIGLVSPNPAVGAVIVRGNRLLAAGWHRAAGCPHAEIEAIRALPGPQDARGAEIYVTLEPCSTSGRTPPCTDALVAAGFARVVFGATDPNVRHRGKAAPILHSAGIEVVAGVLEQQCSDLNRAWNKWIATGMPWVTAKCAMSLDGRISREGSSKWISSPASREDAMLLRARSDAILVGGATLRADNPRLTLRGTLAANFRQPWRIVWTRNKKLLPRDRIVFRDQWRERTLVRSDRSLRRLLAALGRKQITSVLIEGGGRVLGCALDLGLIDEFVCYRAPLLLGGGIAAFRGRGAGAPGAALRLRDVRWQQIGGDLKMEGITCRSEGSDAAPGMVSSKKGRPAHRPTVST